MANEILNEPEFQKKIKTILGLTYLTRARLDGFNSNHYILKDIWKNTKKNNSQFHFLGWDDPKNIPFYPSNDSYRATTSGSIYNRELIAMNEMMIEYDFNEAYTNIMRKYKLPSNVYLENVKMTKEKVLERLSRYDRPHPYRDLDTFIFLKVEIQGYAREDTYIDDSHFSYYTKNLSQTLTITEIELKLIMDFYDIKKLNVLETYTFRCRQGMLDDYFKKIDPLKEDEETLFFYKMLRNKVYGTIGKGKLSDHESKIFRFPMYNRAFASATVGIFRDRMIRYEQKYVNSEYGLIMIKTDGIYFKKEVPEFEALYRKGIVKRNVHVITMDHFKNDYRLRQQKG